MYLMGKKNDTYEEFIAKHNCNVNLIGSAGAIESDGLVEYFNESIETRKVGYTKFLGDQSHIMTLLMVIHIQELN